MAEELPMKKDDIVRNVRAAAIEDLCKDIDDKFQEKIDELKADTETAFKINETDISGELTKCISKMHTYLTRLTEERILLNKIKRKRDDIHGEIYGQLKKGEQIRFDSKSEVEEWINRNPKWIKITSYYNNQIVICEFYEGLLSGMKDKQWILKNKTELKKIELGI
jgi:hypothetical protein